MTNNETIELLRKAKLMRRDIFDLCHRFRFAHLGSCLSMVEFMTVLYWKIMRFPSSLDDIENRDRLIVSKAHGSIALYAALKQRGLISEKDFNTPIDTDDFFLYRHPKRNTRKFIDASAGSLGMGLGYGCGLAMGLRRKNSDNDVHVIIGDGECDEGTVWESASFAGHYHLNHIIVTLDANGIQCDGNCVSVIFKDNWKERWSAFGFEVAEVDGHDIEMLYKAYKTPHPDKPLAVIARTVKGKGASFAENKPEWHYGDLNDELYAIAMAELEKQ